MTFTVPSWYIHAILIIVPHLSFPPLWREARAEDVSTAAGRGERLSRAGPAVHTGTEVVTLVRPAVSTTVQATGRVVRETVTVGRDVVTGTRHAADDVGMGRMTRTTPGTQDLVIDVRDTGTVDRGADGATVAPSAVCGVIEATREVGSTIGAAAHAAATAILQAACACSQTMVRAAHGSPGVEGQHGDRRLHRPAVLHGVA